MTRQIARRIFISGYVQGVGFRYSLLKQVHHGASEVVGFVRNCRDGRVEAYLQGPESQVMQVLSWCRQGPPRAEVSSVDVIEEKTTDQYRNFDIQRDDS